MKQIVENGYKVCEGLGLNPQDTPWYIGLVSLDPPSEAVLERGRQLAEKYGWL